MDDRYDTYLQETTPRPVAAPVQEWELAHCHA
jgi:hypothetical protein